MPRLKQVAAVAVCLATVMLLTAVVAMHAASSRGTAMRSCVAQPEDGSWRNADSNTRSITRVQLRFVCQDQILNGQLYPPGPPWYVHVFGKCHPADCDWSETGAQRLTSGHVYATYNQGYARRYVYARMSQYRPGQLWVWTLTDFADPNRPDYGVHNWYIKQ